jgi:hypothetical protein
MIGVRPDGFWAFEDPQTGWRRIARGGPKYYHTAAAYDSDEDVVVVFGTNQRNDTVWQYRAGDEKGRRMPTPGARPPGDYSVPLVYHQQMRRIVALVGNRDTGRTETWLYATADDSWTLVASADLPFLIGMNYTAAYDPRHELVLLFANKRDDPPAVWALRLMSRGR